MRCHEHVMTAFVVPGLGEVQAEFSRRRLALAGRELPLGVWVGERVSQLCHG